jgi:predicted metal-dependent enzyme (double-stranded beta helix superfamily)
MLEGPGGTRRTIALARPDGATLRLHRPAVDGVQNLVRKIDLVLETTTDQTQIVDAIAREMKKLVARPDAIDDALIRTDPSRYTRTLLYRDPQKRYVVLLLAWSPHQASPIHDHACWGAVGIARGKLAETRYDRAPNGRLVPQETAIERRGDVTTVNPPETDLHRMSNPTNGVTATIHVYGRDMTEANVYDEATGAATSKDIHIDFFGPLAT